MLFGWWKAPHILTGALFKFRLHCLMSPFFNRCFSTLIGIESFMLRRLLILWNYEAIRRFFYLFIFYLSASFICYASQMSTSLFVSWIDTPRVNVYTLTACVMTGFLSVVSLLPLPQLRAEVSGLQGELEGKGAEMETLETLLHRREREKQEGDNLMAMLRTDLSTATQQRSADPQTFGGNYNWLYLICVNIYLVDYCFFFF